MATILSEMEQAMHRQAIDNMRRKQETDFLIDYEVRGTWWAQLISLTPLQNLAAKYFAAKVRRKYNRMEKSFQIQRKLKAARGWTIIQREPRKAGRI